MTNKTLIIFLAVALPAGSLQRPAPHGPNQATLAEIFSAFAWNLEHDGRQEIPRAATTDDVGFLFDEFGLRSTLGVSYREQFGRQFDQLGSELEAACHPGGQDITPALRAELVAIFRRHSERVR